MREIETPISIEELAQQLFELRNQFLQHNHSFIGSGVQQGEVISGFLRSSDYVVGSSGWMIGANNNCELNSGHFRGSIAIGSGNNIFKADTNGICLGNATFASAPFRVDMAGNAVVSSLRRKDFHLFIWFESGDGFGKNISSGGVIYYDGGYIRSITNATNGDYNEFYKMLYTNYTQAFNWDKKRTVKWSIGFQNGGQTNCEHRIVTGGMQNLTDVHMGFKIINGTLYATVANGTTETAVSLQSMSSNFFFIVEVQNIPSEGKVDFYVNGTYATTITTNIPTGTLSSEWLFDWHLINNEAVSKEGWVSWMDIWQEL